MKFYLKSRKAGRFNAVGEYNENEGTFTVLKGSIVSETIANSPKFHSSKAIENQRVDNIAGQTVVRNVVFYSPSTAANFVTGSSTNGHIAWKNKDGCSFKDVYKNK